MFSTKIFRSLKSVIILILIHKLPTTLEITKKFKLILTNRENGNLIEINVKLSSRNCNDDLTRMIRF